jgi:hypothetical protein
VEKLDDWRLKIKTYPTQKRTMEKKVEILVLMVSKKWGQHPSSALFSAAIFI